jgi:hypothetical protein
VIILRQNEGVVDVLGKLEGFKSQTAWKAEGSASVGFAFRFVRSRQVCQQIFLDSIVESIGLAYLLFGKSRYMPTTEICFQGEEQLSKAYVEENTQETNDGVLGGRP